MRDYLIFFVFCIFLFLYFVKKFIISSIFQDIYVVLLMNFFDINFDFRKFQE